MVARKKIFLPLSFKLFAIFMVVVLVPLSLALGVSWVKFNGRLIDAAQAHLEDSADDAERFLKSVAYTQAVELAEEPQLQAALLLADRKTLIRRMQHARQKPYVTAVAIASSNGAILEWQSQAGIKQAVLPLLRRTIQQANSSVQVFPDQEYLSILGAVPIRFRGQTIGAAGVITTLDRTVANWLSDYTGMDVSFINLQGKRVATSHQAALPVLTDEAIQLLQSGRPARTRTIVAAGHDFLASCRPLLLANGQVGGAWCLEQQLASIYSAQREKGLQLLQIIGFAIPIVIILVFFSARLFTDALNKLAQASRLIASGDYTQPVSLTALDKWTFDEVGELNTNFESMRQSLLKKQLAIQEQIGELNRLNEQIVLEKKTMEAVLNSLTDALVVVDAYGQVELYNPEAMRLLHLQPFSRGQSLLELLKGRRFNFRYGAEVVDQHLQRVLSDGEVWHDELIVPGEIAYDFKFVPIFGADRLIRGAVATFHDITEIKRIDQLKSDFISTVSHELRTPLTSISGYLTLMQAGRVTEPQQVQQILTIVLNQTAHLSSLVTNLLELARIEAGRIVMRKEPFDLRAVVDQVLLNLRHFAAEKQIDLQTNLPSNLPPILGDQERVRQVLTNLVGNALKFTPAAQDRYVLVESQPVGGMVQVSVTDNGRGIPEEAMPRLFTRFYQVDSSDTRSVGGSGLGLAIVKQIVEEHGGTVTVCSRQGEGSTFAFTLPCASLAPPARPDVAVSQ